MQRMELTPKVEFLGLTFDLTIILGSLLAAVAVFLIAILASRRVQMVPSGMQNIVEMMIDFSRGITQMSLDQKKAEKFLGLTFTLILFIFFANQIGVILMVTTEVHHPIPSLGITAEKLESAHAIAWLKSPTADINVTIAMALGVAIYSHYLGIRYNPRGYVKHYTNAMLPIHLIEEFSKPLTHAMRLWANIFAGEVLITIMLTKFPLYVTGIPLAVWIGFSLFVGAIQAYIFTVLTNVYIAQKISTEH